MGTPACFATVRLIEQVGAITYKAKRFSLEHKVQDKLKSTTR
jgi:hypothetical protein